MSAVCKYRGVITFWAAHMQAARALMQVMRDACQTTETWFSFQFGQQRGKGIQLDSCAQPQMKKLPGGDGVMAAKYCCAQRKGG